MAESALPPIGLDGYLAHSEAEFPVKDRVRRLVISHFP